MDKTEKLFGIQNLSETQQADLIEKIKELDPQDPEYLEKKLTITDETINRILEENNRAEGENNE